MSKGSAKPKSPIAQEGTRSLADWQKGTVEAWEEQRRKPWQVYVHAELGFRNHWYPAFFSPELAEGDVSSPTGEGLKHFKSLTMLGEPIIFRRVDGKVHAVQDWCLHRGVSFSVRPECYTKESLTCWYHGFTYDVRDGFLTSVITDPTCSLVGKIKLRTYPVQEEKGIVWVFVGDLDPPPPLETDLPPGFLDPEYWFISPGYTTEIGCDWRNAVENAVDPAHPYLHRNADMAKKMKLPFSKTGLSKSRGMEIVQDDPGPYGVKLLRGEANAIWEATIGDVTIRGHVQPGEEKEEVDVRELPEVSVWMPGTVQVEPFPMGTTTVDFHVPIDETNHRYMMTWGRRVKNDEEREAFEAEILDGGVAEMIWKFAEDDVFAREQLAGFYSTPEGWFRERLFGPDIVITSWRTLASRKNRGVQSRGMQ